MIEINSAADLPGTGCFRAYPRHTESQAANKHWIAYGLVPEIFYWKDLDVIYIPIPETYRMDIVEIFADGGCKNNQDPSRRFGYGSYAVRHQGQIKRRSERFEWPGITNNEAEYRAILEAFVYIENLAKRSTRPLAFTVRSDSLLIVKQITGDYQVSSPHLMPYCQQAKAFLNQFPDVKLEWVSRDEMVNILGH